MKKAFTLVEVMLTMSIIGVLLAILIPVLDKSKPDQSTMLYRKAFYTIEESVAYILNDSKLYKEGDLLKAIVKSGESETTTLDTNGKILCQNIADSLNTVGRVRCPGNPNGLVNLYLSNSTNPNGLDMTADNVNFKFSNGIAIGGIYVNGVWEKDNDDLSDVTSEEYLGYKPEEGKADLNKFITLCVDVNGLNKGPNMGCATSHRAIAKRDQFRIRISRDGKVYTGNSVGANNWYVENMMLINPHAVSMKKQKWTDAQITNLTRPSTATNKPDLSSDTDSFTNANFAEFGYIKKEGIWAFTGGIVPSEKQSKAYKDK